MSDLVPSISLDMVVARRDSVVKRVHELDALTRSINDTLDVTFGGNGDRWTWHRLRFEDRSNQTWLGADDIDKIVREIDAQHWRMLMDRSGLLTFMDATARHEWEEKLRKGDVPPLTMENIEATFSSLHIHPPARNRPCARGAVVVHARDQAVGDRRCRRHNAHVAGSHRGTISLDDLCCALGLPGKGDVTGADVGRLMREGKHAEVAAYCADDVRKARSVFRRMTEVRS